MAKALRTIAIIAGSVALIATGFGAAVGAGLIIAGSAAITASAAVTAATVATVASITATAASIGATVTAKPPPLGGTATRFLASTSAPLPYVMGRTAVGGSVVYRRTHNTTGYTLPDLQTFGVILSAGGPIDAIESFTADNVVTSFSGKSAVGTYATWMFQATQLGATPEANALSINGLFVSSGKTTSAPPGWGASNKLSGYAAALWTLRYDQKGKQFSNGIPKPLWVLRGVKVYDPRLDSTYPGGSGSCRALNEATYVYSTNPYLHGLTFALGRFQNGSRVMGIGAPVAGIDVAAFVEGANVAQANGWEIGGVINSNGGKWGMLKSILQAGGGEPFHLGAQISCLISTPRVTIATITTNDVVGDASVTATTPRRDRINSVIPRYRSEAHNWEMISATPVTVAAHVTTDGGLRTKEIEYGLVQGLNQAAALARYDIENAREFGPIVLPVKTRWVGYKPGDCVAVTLPEVGLNAQPVVIRNRTLDPDGGVVTLTARSETNAKHAFALGQTTTAPPTPGVTSPPVAPTPGVSDWTIASNGLTAGASVTPALVLTGATGDNPVDGVQFEYRLYVPAQADGVGWIDAGTAAPGAVRREITAVLPGTQYDVAVSYLLNGFAGGRRILGPVTTAGVGVPWSGVAGAGRPDNNATFGGERIANAALTNDTAEWVLDAGITRVAGLASDPGNYLQFATGGARAALTNGGAVRPTGGGPLFWSVWSYRVAAASASMTGFFNWYKADGAAASTAFTSINILPSAGNVWERLTGKVTPPADAVTFRLDFSIATSGAVVNIAVPSVSNAETGADVTASQPVVSRLSAATGQASSDFVLSTGLRPSQIAASGAARDGDVVTFSPALSGIPEIIFLPGGNTGTAGQNLLIIPEGKSASGFTLRAKTQSVTPGSTITDTGASVGSGADPDRMMNRSSSSDPFNSTWTFSVSVNVGNISLDEPGTIDVGIYLKIGGSWLLLGGFSRGATQTVVVGVYATGVDFGAGNEFGVNVEYAEGAGTGISSFNSVAYTPGTVSETSLTPTGASSIPWIALL